MKEIKAILQPFKVVEVATALQAIPGIGGMTSFEARGFGHQRGQFGVERHVTGTFNFIAKVMLLLVVPDELVDTVLTTIQRHAHTGNVGDGKVFVSPVDEALRIRTGDRGTRAL